MDWGPVIVSSRHRLYSNLAPSTLALEELQVPEPERGCGALTTLT